MLNPLYQEDAEKIGYVPVENIWLLFLYASDLAEFKGKFQNDIEASPTIYDLIAKLLCHSVEKRLKNNLSHTFMPTSSVLTRVRGRIDHLQTSQGLLMQKGQIACNYEDLTVNTPQNRLVRTALRKFMLKVDKTTASRCKYFDNYLSTLGVDSKPVSEHEVRDIHIRRNDKDDRLMVELAKLVFSLKLPTRNPGRYDVSDLDVSARLVRKLFEKAIRNFYKIELSAQDGWRTYPTEKQLKWPIEKQSSRIDEIMPQMRADIIIDNEIQNNRIIIDTKFAKIFGKSPYREKTLKSYYIYQLYAYLRSQEEIDEVGVQNSQGILLHPKVGEDVDEYIEMQGHKLRFVTINLAQSSDNVISDLKAIIY